MSRTLQQTLGFVLAAIVATVLGFTCLAAWGQDETFNEFLREIDPNAQDTEPPSGEADLPGEDQEEPTEGDPGEGGPGEATPEEETPPQYNAGQAQLLAITQARNSGLRMHPTLMASAQSLADYHAATGRWGHSSRSWRPNASENIAWNGERSVAKLGRQWVNSRGHRINWDTQRNYVGVGVAFSSGRVYGVQHFSNGPSQFAGGAPYLQSSGRSTVARSRWRPFSRLRFRRRR